MGVKSMNRRYDTQKNELLISISNLKKKLQAADRIGDVQAQLKIMGQIEAKAHKLESLTKDAPVKNDQGIGSNMTTKDWIERQKRRRRKI
jgi:hypothetical protein